MGSEAYKFADWLAYARQTYWQMLPLGPTGYGDSPYQSSSSYAGNPYMIDLDVLIEEKLLKEDEVKKVNWGSDLSHVDFGNMWEKRFPVLEKAYKRFKPNKEYEAFCKKNKDWLDDFSLFMSVKEKFKNGQWTEWPQDIKLRQKAAMASVANGNLNGLAVGTPFKCLMQSVGQTKHRSQAWPVCTDFVTSDLGGIMEDKSL